MTRVEIDPAVTEARVPNLFLQPIVENAIHHGITQQMGTGVIAIKARRDNSRLRIEVSDNGPGLQSSGNGKSGVGLTNSGEEVIKTTELSYFSRGLESEEFARQALVETHRRGVERAGWGGECATKGDRAKS